MYKQTNKKSCKRYKTVRRAFISYRNVCIYIYLVNTKTHTHTLSHTGTHRPIYKQYNKQRQQNTNIHQSRLL